MARGQAGRGNHANTPRESQSPTDSTGTVDSDMFASDEEIRDEWHRMMSKYRTLEAKLKSQSERMAEQDRMLARKKNELSRRKHSG